MRIRFTILPLLAVALSAGSVAAAPVDTGFVDRGTVRFRNVEIEERSTLSGEGLVQAGVEPARIALAHGGYLELQPDTQIRLSTGDDGVVTVTVVRGLVVLETTSSKRLSAGRNSVFRLDGAAIRAGVVAEEPELDDDRRPPVKLHPED